MRRCLLLWEAILLAMSGTVRSQDRLPGEPQLITRSRRILSVKSWPTPYYVWLTQNRLVALQETTQPWRDFPLPNMHVPIVILVNSDTGSTQPLAAFNTRRIIPGSFLRDVRASPDGKWLLFRTGEGVLNSPGVSEVWVQTGSDGTPWFEAREAIGGRALSRPAWTRDSRRWITLADGNAYMKSSVFNISDLNAPSSLSFPKWKSQLKTRGYYDLLGVRSDGRVLARLITVPLFSRPLECVDFGIEPNAAPPHLFHTDPPRGKFMQEVVLSPDGRKLAWMMVAKQYRDKHDLISGDELWVSKVDGTQMKRLGWLLDNRDRNHPDKPMWPEGDVPDDLRWLPDGKHLSFIYKDALYTVPID